MKARVALVSVLAAIVVMLIWNLVFFSPAGKDVDKARARRDNAAQQNDILKRRLAILSAHPIDATKLQAELDKLQAAIPTQPQLEGFIRSAYAIRTKAGVDWVSIQPSLPTAGAGPSEIKMQIVVRGGFFQVLDYLNRLEALDRLVVVDGINVQTSDSSTSSGTSGTTPTTTSSGAPDLSVTLNARMFTEAQVATPGGSTSGGTAGTTTTTRPAGGAVTTPTNPGVSN